jgi:hypothetical protein
MGLLEKCRHVLSCKPLSLFGSPASLDNEVHKVPILLSCGLFLGLNLQHSKPWVKVSVQIKLHECFPRVIGPPRW